MNGREFAEDVILKSLPLRQLSSTMKPIGFASGCQIVYREVPFILTVQHATGNAGNWAVEIGVDPVRGATEYYQLGPMNYLSAGKIDIDSDRPPESAVEEMFRDMKQIDFAYKRLDSPLQPKHQEFIERNGEHCLQSLPKRSISTSLEDGSSIFQDLWVLRTGET